MNIPFVDLRAQYDSIKDEIGATISEVVSKGTFVGGNYVEEFERSFAEIHESRHCIGVGNGSDALYVALRAVGIGSGDEVITVPNSWISTTEAIVRVGAKPVFVDIEPDHHLMDVTKIEEKINSNTKAILPVHLYGHPADMNAILSISKAHNLKIIEDCAQAHLSSYSGRKVGGFGDVSIFSFYPSKNLGAYGDAGCVLTSSDEIAENCRSIANHGSLVKHTHANHGVNSRLDSLQAAVLNVKLKHLEQWTEMRRAAAEIYSHQLGAISGVDLPQQSTQARHVYHLYVIRTSRRDQLRDFLTKHGVGTGIHYPTLIPFQPVFEKMGYKHEDFAIARRYADEILSLPMYAEIPSEHIDRVAELIDQFWS